MATVAELPSTLEQRLTKVADRLRWLRVARGLGWMVLALSFLAGVAILGDYLLDLPAVVRGVLLAGWMSCGALILTFGLIVPLNRRLDIEALAAAVEEKYPDLAERLTTSVELADEADLHHGSPTLIRLLMNETERQTRGIDFGRAAPFRLTIPLVCTAAALFLGLIAPGVIWPRSYAHLCRGEFRRRSRRIRWK